MVCTRRGFASRLGLLLAGVSGAGDWARSAACADPSSALAAQHEEHSKLPMTTHASGNAENKLAAAEEIWEKLLAGNQRFVAGKLMARDVVARRSAVLAAQQPQVVAVPVTRGARQVQS